MLKFFKRLVRECDLLFLLLFFIATTGYGRGVDEDAVLKLLITSIIVTILYLRIVKQKTELLLCSFVGILLVLNIIINDCGIGGALGCWEFFILLYMARYVTISQKTFHLLFYVCAFFVCVYAIIIYLNPSLIEFGGDMNSNMVSIFSFFMMFFSILFIPKYNVFNMLILMLALLAALYLISISGSRSTQIATLITSLGLMFFRMKTKISLFNKRFLYIVSLSVIVFALYYVIISINSKHTFITTYLGIFSEMTGNVKGSDSSLRGEMWKEAFHYFYESPLLGTGSKIRIRVYGNEALALHNSTLNILIVYGVIIYCLFLFKEINYFKKLFLGKYTSLLVVEGGIVYIGVLLISYSESILLDFSMFYSMVPLFYAFSNYNTNRTGAINI